MSHNHKIHNILFLHWYNILYSQERLELYNECPIPQMGIYIIYIYILYLCKNTWNVKLTMYLVDKECDYVNYGIKPALAFCYMNV